MNVHCLTQSQSYIHDALGHGRVFLSHSDVPCRCAALDKAYVILCVFSREISSAAERQLWSRAWGNSKVQLHSEERTLNQPHFPFWFFPPFFSRFTHQIWTNVLGRGKNAPTNLQQIQEGRRRYYINRQQNQLYLLTSMTEKPLKELLMGLTYTYFFPNSIYGAVMVSAHFWHLNQEHQLCFSLRNSPIIGCTSKYSPQNI